MTQFKDTIPLDAGDIAWLQSYAADVRAHFEPLFRSEAKRFVHRERLLQRFEAAVAGVIANGRGKFVAVDETQNELCIVEALLTTSRQLATSPITYEWALPGTGKTIDFAALLPEGPMLYVDAKTIRPKRIDRWAQYEKAKETPNWFPPHVQYVLNRDWLGGEFWHAAFAARSRMLEYSMELETKAASAGLIDRGAILVMAFCSDGFTWREDELEDFVEFYRTGKHRPDDPFAQAELHHIKQNGIELSRSISHFAYMARRNGEVTWKRLNWDVRAPDIPKGF